MTLSRLFHSLTRRVPETDAAARPRRAGATGSSPDLGALLESSMLQLVPAKEKEHVLGAQREVRERIAEVLPGVAFDAEGRGAFTRAGYSITFDTGHDDYVRSVRVQITGGSAATPPLTRLMAKTGWRLVPSSN